MFSHIFFSNYFGLFRIVVFDFFGLLILLARKRVQVLHVGDKDGADAYRRQDAHDWREHQH